MLDNKDSGEVSSLCDVTTVHNAAKNCERLSISAQNQQSGNLDSEGEAEEAVTCFCSSPDQTRPCVWLSSRPPFLPHLLTTSLFFLVQFLLLLSAGKVGGGSKGWQNSRTLETCPIPALQRAPQLLWLETGLVSVSLYLPAAPSPARDSLLLLIFCSGAAVEAASGI